MLLVAQPKAKEGKLPACCRRDGKHRCAMTAPSTQTGGLNLEAVRPKCAQYPSRSSEAPVVVHYAAPAASAMEIALTLDSVVEQTDAQGRISFSRSRQKRGPPSPLS